MEHRHMNSTVETPPDVPFVITEARPEHMAQIAEIYAYYVRGSICTMEEIPPTTTEMHQRLDVLRRGGLPWLVAVRGNEVLGYAYAGRYRARVGYQGTAETSIYVGPAYAGRRIDQALLGSLIGQCRQLGMRQMVAVIVEDEGARSSLRLYERYGFIRAGAFKEIGRKFGRAVDTVLMQRGLVES